jgi:rhodanese-related sulfurtransferase
MYSPVDPVHPRGAQPMLEVDLDAFARAQADGALVIDVREPSEYAEGHVPGVRPVPLGALPDHVAELPRDQPVYVICAHGVRSLSAAQYLARAGIDARSVAGGTSAWEASGRRMTRGD